MHDKEFWLSVDIHQGNIEDVIADMKTILLTLQRDYLRVSDSEMAEKIGYDPRYLKTILSSKSKEPHVGISLIKKICQAYDLKCTLKISNS